MELFDQPIHDPVVLARAEMTFDLCETAEQIMRQNFRRRHPELAESEVEKRLVQWYQRRGREDTYGRPSKEWAARFGSQP